jgi:hypothetical protein
MQGEMLIPGGRDDDQLHCAMMYVWCRR